MDKYDDSLYESEDFMTIDNGTASVIKQRFRKGDTEYVLYAVNTDYNPDAMILIESIKKGVLLLLDNSSKYRTGPTVHCTVHCRIDGKWVCIDVSDDGAGVPEHALEHLFQAFYRPEKSRKDTHKGSGLGLAISRNIINAHGGSISAENRSGLVIKIRLPIEEEAE